MAGRGDFPPSGFGTRLRDHRESRGLTQKELAEKTGIHPNTLAKLERGEHEPTWPLVLVFAAALGVSCEAFAQCDDVTGPGEEPERTALGKRK